MPSMDLNKPLWELHIEDWALPGWRGLTKKGGGTITAKSWGLLIVLILAASLPACAPANIQPEIDSRLDPAVLYPHMNSKVKDLGSLSKCVEEPGIRVVNAEERTEKFWVHRDHLFVIPKDFSAKFVSYLKDALTRHKVLLDNNSGREIRVSFVGAKLHHGGVFGSWGAMVKMKLSIPGEKFVTEVESTDWAGWSNWYWAAAYAVHNVTMKIVKDSTIKNYILCSKK